MDEWGWQAEFLDGPLKGDDHMRYFSGAFQVATALWYAKVDPREGSPAGWAMVGWEPGIGHPDPPWPEQVHYRIDLGESSVFAQPPRGGGGDRGIARYRLATEELTPEEHARRFNEFRDLTGDLPVTPAMRLGADIPPDNRFRYVAEVARAELLEAMRHEPRLEVHDRRAMQAMLDWIVGIAGLRTSD